MKTLHTARFSLISTLFIALFGAGAMPAVWAQQGSSGSMVLEEIIVTAQKREERIQDVPISITTLRPEQLATVTAGVPDIRFLSGRVANLGVESSYGRVFPRFYIRGYGNTDFDLNGSQPVSLVIDEIVQENPALKGFPVFDVDRIEVLRGPQGTLFGRNTPAGAVKIESVKPSDESSGYFRASYGTYNAAHVEGAIGGGFGNGWSARLSALYLRQDDYVNNGYTGKKDQYEGFDEWAARLQLAYDNGGMFKALFNVHHRDLDGSAILFRANIIHPGTNSLDRQNYHRNTVYFDGLNYQKLKSTGGMAKLEWDLGAATLTSVTGYETVKMLSRGDIDGGFGGACCTASWGPGFIPFDSETADGLRDHKQWTEELRLSSNSDGPLDWLIGFFYFDEDFKIDTFNYATLFGGGLNGLVLQGQQAKSYAFFGHLDYDLSDRFTLGAGVRYSDDKKDYFAQRFISPIAFTGAANEYGPIYANPDDSQVTWDVSGNYAVNDEVNLYARIATGFRAPSIQGRLLFGDTVSVADSETSISYEAGIKADLAGGKARVNFNVYSYTVDDAQLTAVGGQANFNQVINANKLAGKGFELDIQAYLLPQLLVTWSSGYTDTEIKDKNLAVAGCGAPCTVLDPPGPIAGTYLINGNRLPQSPKFTTSLIADWRHDLDNGQVYAIGDWVYRDEINFVLYEAKEYRGQSLSEVGLRLGYQWSDGHHDVSVFGRNIFDRTENIYTIDFNNLTGIVNEPRTFGVEYNYRY